MPLTAGDWIALSGVAVALFVGLDALRQASKHNKKTLEQAKKNLEVQLLHEDRKKALFKLHSILEASKTYPDLKDSTLKFLDSMEGGFIPDETRKHIYSEMGELDEFARKDPSEPPQEDPSDEEIERWEQAREEEEASKDIYDRYNEAFSAKMNILKFKTNEKIRGDLTKPTKRL